MKRKNSVPWQHGSVTGYQNHDCRCQPCTSAFSAYYRKRVRGVCERCGGPTANKYKAKRCRACRLELATVTNHGTVAMYARGCHCELCRAASAAARRGRRHAAKRRQETR